MKGTLTPYSPCYGGPQKGTPNFEKASFINYEQKSPGITSAEVHLGSSDFHLSASRRAGCVCSCFVCHLVPYLGVRIQCSESWYVLMEVLSGLSPAGSSLHHGVVTKMNNCNGDAEGLSGNFATCFVVLEVSCNSENNLLLTRSPKP